MIIVLFFLNQYKIKIAKILMNFKNIYIYLMIIKKKLFIYIVFILIF